MFWKKKSKKKTKSSNVVNVLNIYKTNEGYWAFDDADLNIIREPFIADINLMIDMCAEGETKLLVYISEYYISEETNVLHKVEGTIDIYQLSDTEIQGWLCSCLLQYFKTYPDFLHFKIQKIK